jgi:hypothetical protein
MNLNFPKQEFILNNRFDIIKNLLMQTQKLQLNEIISVIPRLFRLTIILTISTFIGYMASIYVYNQFQTTSSVTGRG